MGQKERIAPPIIPINASGFLEMVPVAEECHFHHLKGTKLDTTADTDYRRGVNVVSQTEPEQRQVSAAPKIRVLQRPRINAVATPNEAGAHEALCSSEHQTNNGRNFMETEHQLQQMIQTQLDKVLKMNLAQLTGTKVCRCQATCH